jgi:hypothetical protein
MRRRARQGGDESEDEADGKLAYIAADGIRLSCKPHAWGRSGPFGSQKQAIFAARRGPRPIAATSMLNICIIAAEGSFTRFGVVQLINCLRLPTNGNHEEHKEHE